MKKLLNLLVANKERGKKTVVNQEGDTLKITINDVIYGDGWGFGAEQLRAALADFDGDRIEIYLNSPGGDVFEARTMCSMLARQTAHKVVYIDGLAASCASWLALSGDEVVMANGTRMMVHRSWCLSIDNCAGLRKTADILESLDSDMVNDYMEAVQKHGKDTTVEEMTGYVDAETWFTPQQALDIGLIDRIDGQKSDAAANFDLSAFENAPKPDALPAQNNVDRDVAIAAQIARNERHLRIMA